MLLPSRVASLCALGIAAVLATPRPDDSGKTVQPAVVPRIIGGSPASNSAFSFTGKMLARDPKYAGTTCTGTLITPSIVITTADCLITSGNTWYNSNLVTVSFGSTLQDVYTARQLMISDQYNSNTKHYNFGLIFLAQSVPSSVATPARVYMGQPAANTPVIAAGYGMTANTNGTYPSQLITVGLTLSSQSFCASKNSYFDSNSQICTDGGSGKDTCPGDAGGPLLVPVDSSTYALLGVTSVSTIPKGSSNPYCGLPGSVGYYERIGFWVQWMVKNANLTSSDISTIGSSPGAPSGSSGNGAATDADLAATGAGASAGGFTFTRLNPTPATTTPATTTPATTAGQTSAPPSFTTQPPNSQGPAPVLTQKGSGSALPFRIEFSSVFMAVVALLFTLFA